MKNSQFQVSNFSKNAAKNVIPGGKEATLRKVADKSPREIQHKPGCLGEATQGRARQWAKLHSSMHYS